MVKKTPHIGALFVIRFNVTALLLIDNSYSYSLL